MDNAKVTYKLFKYVGFTKEVKLPDEIVNTFGYATAIVILFAVLFFLTGHAEVLILGSIFLVLYLLYFVSEKNTIERQAMKCYAKDNEDTIWLVKVTPKKVSLSSEGVTAHNYAYDTYGATHKAHDDSYVIEKIKNQRKRDIFSFLEEEDKVIKINDIEVVGSSRNYYYVKALVNGSYRKTIRVYKCFSNLDELLGLENE